MTISSEVRDAQVSLCAKFGAPFCECGPDERAGVALGTLQQGPIYGVRKQNADGSSSWYIWGGPHSTHVDFYRPVCAGHLQELLPMVVPYLALPSGYKFIIDRQGYEDVWREEEPPEPARAPVHPDGERH